MVSLQNGSCDTRLAQEESITSHTDYGRWHRANLTSDEFHQLLLFLSPDHVVEMDNPWSSGGHATRYPHKVIGIHGFVGGFDVDEDGWIDCMLQCPGEYWEQMTVEDTWRLFTGLKHRYKMRCSRIDYAVDDSTYKAIPVEEMWEAAREGNNFYFRKIGISASGNCGKEELKETKYFGSRESSKFTRVYDHDGECLRHETEFKRHAAIQYFDLIADLNREDFRYVTEDFDGYRDTDGSLVEDFGTIIARRMGGAVVGAIDFRTRDAYTDSSRVSARDSERLSFYQEYINKVGAAVIRIKASPPVKSLHKTYEWIKRQCSPTLAMFREGLGRHQFNLLIQEIVNEGSQRMDNLKELWAKEIRRKPTCFQR